jgi:hypothetical protein
MGALCGFTRRRWRPARLTADTSGARLADRADTSDGRLDSRLARGHARAGCAERPCRQTRQGAAPPRGVGGLIPLQGRPVSGLPARPQLREIPKTFLL